MKTRRLQLGRIFDPKSGYVVDEAMMVFMPAPHSYTCEDVIEIQAHAGVVGLNAILKLVLRQGARIAEPGEFTKRAFLNGRIDLTQAEAIIDVINAKTERALQLAADQINGAMRDIIEKATGVVSRLLGDVEAAIDFPEESEDVFFDDGAARLSNEVIAPLNTLLGNYKAGHLIREGLRIVILGRPNVGKSSLMNRLLNRNRAIVTEIPGTTRDTIEEAFNLNGVPAVLVDTAGLRESVDPVESAGILRAERLAKEADLILFMMDAGEGVTPADEAIYKKIVNKPMLMVLNKVELEEKDRPTVIPESWLFNEEIVRTSVRHEKGIDRLKTKIYDYAVGNDALKEGQIVPNLRQKSLIEKGIQAAWAAERAITEGLSPELLAIDLRDTMTALNQIIGKDEKYDVLNEIFRRFCIGK